MKPFEIKFDPQIDVNPAKYREGFIEDLDVAAVMASIAGLYNVEYHINGIPYSYYPSSILTVLNDIHLERELMRRRESHHMTLSGYTVLRAEFRGRDIYIFDPVVYGDHASARPPIATMKAEIVDDAFERALDRLYALISGRLNGVNK